MTRTHRPTSDKIDIYRKIIDKLMRILARRIRVLWLRRDKFSWTTESCGGKGMAQPLSQEERVLTLALTGFYCFSGHITLRMVLIYYAQVPLVLIENKGEDVANHIKKEGYLQM